MAVAPKDTLPQNLRQKARKELHEDERHLKAHIESFQRWVDSLPHITYPKDPKLLLPFLRHAKYRHDKAQARLDNFCTLRASDLNGVPHWFHFPPVNDPIVNTYLKAGLVVELGRTKDDVLILLIRIGSWDPDILPMNLIRPLGYMNLERYVLDPVTQIAGYGLFFDMTGLSSRQLMHRKDKSEIKLEMKVFQEGLPLRVKHLIYYNEPAIVDVMFKLMDTWISDKIRQRMLRVKTNIDKAYDKVPGLKDLMPAEYGGKNGKLSDLIENHARRFREFYSKPPPWIGVRVDESKRPDSAKNYMREYKDVNIDIFGTKGTYISLDPGD
ncbi:Alpha-tocopherol transfer protein [Fasciola hepatica]|uniref:Alpha-tocopherol transfer protein n=1 Tax=Fasciola hepatica TaxID=6192 RepID=A0A4E0RHZ7_FASHE|nr:Alpha-tocopherol transfer protein [Fasciola hepatica]